MKRMKKSILLILGSVFALASIPIAVIYNENNKNNSVIKNYISTMKSDSENVQKILAKEKKENLEEEKNQIIEAFDFEKKSLTIEKKLNMSKKNYLNNENHDEILDENVLEYAKNKSLEYYDLILNEEFSLIDLLSIANNQGYSYENQLDDFNKFNSIEKENNNNTNINLHAKVSNISGGNNSNANDKNNISSFELKPISYMVNSLLNATIQSGVFAGLAVAVAAGYWAASVFSFGGTVASAIAATTQASVLSAQATVYEVTYAFIKDSKDYEKVKNEYVFKEENDIVSWSMSTAFFSLTVISFFNWIKTTVNTFKIASNVAKTAIYSTIWAAPTGIGFIIIADLMITFAGLIASLPF